MTANVTRRHDDVGSPTKPREELMCSATRAARIRRIARIVIPAELLVFTPQPRRTTQYE
jgi:hypothetical protein